MVIEKTEIAEILNNFKDWGSPKTTSTEGQGFLLKGNQLIANNGSEAIKTKISNDTDEEFVIPLSAIDLINNLPPGPIEITKPKKKVIVSAKTAGIKSSFPTFDADLFPELNVNDADLFDCEHLEIEGKIFDDIISKILYACPSNNSKPIFNGILINGKSGVRVDFVACDGYRLAFANEKIACDIKVVIPKGAIKKVLQIAKNDDRVDVYCLKNKVVIYRNDYVIYSNLLSGDYIDYEQAFPKSFNEEISLDKAAFEKAVKRSLICYGNNKGACTVLNGANEQLTVSINNSSNEYTETLLSKEMDVFKQEARIGVNGKFLSETLGAIKSDLVRLKYVAPTSPMVLTSADEQRVYHMILPMRLKGGAV